MATKTSNYEFNKPEQNDFYDVDVQNENWDKVDEELSEFDDSGVTEDIKSFPDFLSKFVTGNKVAITLRNLKAGLQFVLHAGQIVNNCVTDNAGLPLSAAQGKVLKDLYTQLYSELPKIVYLRDVGDIALSLSNINKEIVFFSLNGTDYSGSKPINDDSFIYGTGYAVLRYDSYIGEVGYVKNYKFVYNVKNKQFKWL